MESNLYADGISAGGQAFITRLLRFFQNLYKKRMAETYIIALAGNQGAGKDSVFHALTGVDRHSKIRSGKTPVCAEGEYTYKDIGYLLVNLPGTGSLYSHLEEEEFVRNFISGGEAKTTIVVCDAGCLERNLNLVLQVMRLNTRVVVCVDFSDGVREDGGFVDLPLLSDLLGVPVCGMNGGKEEGMADLMEAVASMTSFSVRVPWGNVSDNLLSLEEVADIALLAEKVAGKVVKNIDYTL